MVVVGGGNVAMDCARTSVRAGADEVSWCTGAASDDMTALPAEVESAIAEGVEMIVLEAPPASRWTSADIARRSSRRPQMIGPVRGGRPAPMAADKPTRRIEADIILIAVGARCGVGPVGVRHEHHLGGCFNADDHLAAEGYDHVFVGGDCQTGPSTVIRAIGAGKVAARNIDEFFGIPSQAAVRHRRARTVAERPHAQGARGDNRASCARAAARFRWRRERNEPRRGRAGVRALPALRSFRLRRYGRRQAPVCLSITIDGIALDVAEGSTIPMPRALPASASPRCAS